MSERLTKERESEIRNAVQSGNESAGRHRLETWCSDLLAEVEVLRDQLDAALTEADEARSERDQLQERLRGAYEAARVGCHREACSVPEEIEWRVALGDSALAPTRSRRR